MNFGMWRKALTIIPAVSKEEWNHLDIISKWLIATRAAVLVMTFISAALAGLFAWREHSFSFLSWLALTFGLIMAHASNNLLNDFVDYSRGVDEKNYFRSLYGPHPLTNQLMTKRQHFSYFVISGSLALASGLILIWSNNFDLFAWFLLGAGAFLLLFYTWPLKYIALGEISVLLTWGPLMVGGGYYVLTHHWDWKVVLAGTIYALGVTTVIFGKHIDKLQADQKKNIHTLPVLIGEKAARYSIIGMIILQYIFIIFLVTIQYFTPLMLFVFLSVSRLYKILPAFLKPKPIERPTNFPEGQGGWPLYFAPLAFWYNRSFGTIFILALIIDTFIRLLFPTFWR